MKNIFTLKEFLLAICMFPLMILVVPIIGDLLLPGGYGQLHRFPDDDAIEIEFLVRIFLVGLIPAFIYPNKFYLWPILSWGFASLILFLFSIFSSGIHSAFTVLYLGGIFSIPLIALTFVGSLTGKVIKSILETRREKHAV